MRVLIALAVAVTLATANRAAAVVPGPDGPPRSDPAVLARALHVDPATRAEAALALGRTPDGAALATLRHLLTTDRDRDVRRAAAGALGSSGVGSEQELLEIASRQDPDPTVRAAAAVGARRLWGLRRRPRLAAGLSAIPVCPGCGHFYLKQPGTALGFLGTTAGAFGLGLALIAESADSVDGDIKFDSPRGPIGFQLLTAAQNLYFYGIFAAYRDARILRGDAGYALPSSRESLGDLVSAPVRPRVLARPWFWAGLPIMFGAAMGFTHALDPDFLDGDHRKLTDGGGVNFLGRKYASGTGFLLGEAYYAGLFVPVSVGEEALFRGVIQPELSEAFGPWGGWAATSLLFGAAHIGNFLTGEDGYRTALVAIPYLTAVGSYLGYVSMKTGNRLETSVALHFWYDFLLGTTSFLMNPDNQPFVVRIGFPL